MLKQNIQGLQQKTIDVVCSDGDQDALVALLAGEVEKFALKGQGNMPEIPNPLNRKNIIISSNDGGLRRSCMLFLPHLKASSNFNDLEASIVGSFNCSYDSDLKAEKITLKFDA